MGSISIIHPDIVDNPGVLVTVGVDTLIPHHVAFGADGLIDQTNLLYPSITNSTMLTLEEEHTSLTTDYVTGIVNHMLLDPVANAAGTVAMGFDTEVAVKAGNNKNIGVVQSFYTEVRHNGTGTVVSAYGPSTKVVNGSTGAISFLYANYIDIRNDGGGTVGRTTALYSLIGNEDGVMGPAYHIYIDSPWGTDVAAITELTGLYIADQTGSASSFNIQSKGANSRNVFEGTVTVKDEAYGAGWNGSLQVPTKNAIYDKIESLGGGGSGDVVGPAGATDNAVALFDGTTGLLLKNSALLFSSNKLGVGAGALEYGIDYRPASGVTAQKTVIFQDATTTTGITKVVIREGEGQSTNKLLDFQLNNGTSSGFIETDGGSAILSFYFLKNPNQGFFSLDPSGLTLAATKKVLWTEDNTTYGAVDLGVGRNAAGVLEVNSGVAGTLRDLKLRYIEMTEMTAPAAPATNNARFFLQDNGSGKTQYMVQFATGSAIQLAIEV